MNQIFDRKNVYCIPSDKYTDSSSFFYGCGSTKDQEVTESSDLQKKQHVGFN